MLLRRMVRFVSVSLPNNGEWIPGLFLRIFFYYYLFLSDPILCWQHLLWIGTFLSFPLWILRNGPIRQTESTSDFPYNFFTSAHDCNHLYTHKNGTPESLILVYAQSSSSRNGFLRRIGSSRKALYFSSQYYVHYIMEWNPTRTDVVR